MNIFEKCKQIYEAVRYFTYGIPVDGVIKSVPTAEYFDENYRFLSPQEFVDLEGGVCWDYVEYERTCCENHGLKYHQYYIITDTPPNYDTHTFITVEDGDELIYIESSFKKVEHIIDGVKKFKSLEEIVNLITTTMFSCNGNDKRFDEIKYDVMEYHGHPAYGCTCEEYMKWMNENAEMVIQDTAINPKNIDTDELNVEEMAIPEYHTHEDDEEYNETIHDHIADEDDIYNESCVQRGRNLADPDGVMPGSGKSKEELERELAKYIKTVKEDDVYNESWTDFKNGVHPSSGLMFHVSLKNDMDGKTINPQIPSYITDGGELDDNYQEDTKTKRLCVSPSIEGCLIAILNYNKIREHVGDKFYVYTPEKPFSQYKHKTNKEIVKDKLVFDANITKEAWILEPCKLKLYGIIKLKKVKDLKEKPTVEKNIKMNTIKLDYEWIMTPKASGKFNKAIGDSPDKEDTKEKPIKEYDNILVSNEEFFMEAFKSDMRKKQNESDRVSNVNSLNNFKSIFKDYESTFGHESKFCHSFYAPENINSDIIKTKKFNINLYTEAYKYLIDLFMKLKNALKQNDVVHSKSLRDKICELTIGTSKSQNALSIGNSEEKISITMMPKSYRKIDTSKYHLFVHRSDNGNLSSLKPSLGKVYDDNNIFMYRSSVVYLFAFEKTDDPDKKKKQFNNFDGFAASSYGDYIYEYKPKPTDVFYIDEHIFERLFKGDRSYIPVNIETKNPLHVTRISVDQVREQLFGNNKITTESSSVLVSNEEFFGLSMIQESHKNITKHSFKSLTKKGITVDHDSETGKLVKKVIDNVLKYHSLPSIKLNPSGFGVAKETDTFFYGYPRYIDGEIPTSKGKQLRFMAQINCKELKSLPDYPHTGLLQFWVHGDSEILNGAVKVIYIEKPNKNNIANVSLDEALYSYDEPGDFPYIDIKGYNHSDNLLFKSTTKETIGPNITDLEVLYKIFSEEYKKLTGKKADISALDDYIWDDDRLQPSWGNRVGGYPSSTQETSSKRTKSWNTMLLQLESIDREVYWGDFGIAAFYISHDDLIKRDFSKVGFDWDCY